MIEQESDSTSVDTKKEKEEFPEQEAFIGKKNRLKELFNSLIKRDRLDINRYSIRAIFTTMKLSTLPM